VYHLVQCDALNGGVVGVSDPVRLILGEGLKTKLEDLGDFSCCGDALLVKGDYVLGVFC